MKTVSIVVFIVFLVFGGPILIFFLIAFISNKKIDRENNKVKEMKEQKSNVKCIYCGKLSFASNARFIGNGEWICHSCINKLFISESAYNDYLRWHDNEIPNFNGNEERRKKIYTIRNAMSFGNWEKYKNILLINKKTFEMIPCQDPTIYTTRKLYEDGGYGTKIKIKDIISMKIYFKWVPTDLELQKEIVAAKNRMNLGKRLAVANELWGTVGVLNEMCKDINGPLSNSRISFAELVITLKNGESISCFIKAPFNCDKGSKTFNSFINECQSTIDYINYLYNNFS